MNWRQHDAARQVVINLRCDPAHGSSGVVALPDARGSPCGSQTLREGPAKPQPSTVSESFMSIAHDGAAIISGLHVEMLPHGFGPVPISGGVRLGKRQPPRLSVGGDFPRVAR